MSSLIHIGGNVYGCGNIGDDAVLAGLLAITRAVMPSSQISISSYRAQDLAFVQEGGVVCDCYDANQVQSAISDAECFVIGGGTMIGDELGLNFPLTHNLKRAAIASFMGKPVVLAGIGANKPRTGEGRRLARELLRFSSVVTVRDKESLDVCAELAGTRSKISLTADPAFILEPIETARTRKTKSFLRSLGKPIGVNVINEVWTHDMSYKKAIADCLEHLAKEDGYYPVFFCNEVRSGERYDQMANEMTARMLHCEYQFLDPCYYSPCEMVDIIGSFSLVFSMRMHSLIFAAITGVPFATVSRVDKVDNFMSQFGFSPEGHIDDCDGSKMAVAVRERLRAWPVLRNGVASRVEELRRRAHLNGEHIKGGLRQTRRRIIRCSSFDYCNIKEDGLPLSARLRLFFLRHDKRGNAIRSFCRGLVSRIMGKGRRKTTL